MSERLIVFLVGAVQFVNILDFMMVMPLGPDFARALGIPTSHLGLVGGSYTAAAAVAGLVGAPSSTASIAARRSPSRCSASSSARPRARSRAASPSLVAARVVAGAFGGPATSLSLSIVADVVPPERRGRAMGAVMGAFSVASVLGVPAGLELARARRLARSVHRRREPGRRHRRARRSARCRAWRGHIVAAEARSVIAGRDWSACSATAWFGSRWA